MSNLHSKSAKDRLIETAQELFLREGIPHTGINMVTAKSNVAKMTLYNNFASKEALILAVFEREANLRKQEVLMAQASLEDPIERALSLFSVALKHASRTDFRGCAFINLAVETASPKSPLHKLALQHKEWMANNIKAQLDKKNYNSTEKLAQQTLMLWDGSLVEAYIQQSDAPILLASEAAFALIKAEKK